MPVTARGQEQRSQIIAAAIDVLSEEGLSGSSTRKIANKAKVNQAMIMYYFGGKDGLLFAVQEEIMHRLRDILSEKTRLDEGLRVALESGLEAFWDHVESTINYQMMQYELAIYAIRTPCANQLMERQYAGYRNVVEQMIRQSYKPSEHENAPWVEELAAFILASMDGLILQYIADRNSHRARRVLHHVVEAAVAMAGEA
ncbi:TetR/AcrR family transcriptional regulator [Alicyclobacillus curvatus]|nr:TetR/AcrR family transcriptional regulator [Alicyclobacillus curvatus]